MTTIFIDIDGTLTDHPGCRCGDPVQSRIDLVKKMITEGHEIIIWSGGGRAWAQEFCEMHGINPIAVIGKPQICIDDNCKIRPNGLDVKSPRFLDR